MPTQRLLKNAEFGTFWDILGHREEFWLENAQHTAYHEECFHDAFTGHCRIVRTHTFFFHDGKASYGRKDTAETAVARGV